MKHACLAAIVGLCLFPTDSPADDELSPAETKAALIKAGEFFRTHASAGGGYVYQVSADLSKREGEGVTSPTTAWIQPPGTPFVGMTYLEAYRLTREPVLLDAAIETGMALVNGQLDSGGWDNKIEFDPEIRKKYSYRKGGDPKRRSRTTFDDDKSQSALRFLMHLDRELNSKNEAIHEAVQYAIDHFLEAQYPNGAWPQQYREPFDPDDFPILQASYPKDWPREFPHERYTAYYTLNDNTISDVIETMLVAYDLYGDERCLEAAKRGGNFFLLAQMPDPQPGWCQQYNAQMQPMWARKFEPAAITGGESQGVMATLMLLYRRTGESKYLQPIPRALAYYNDSLLNDGRLARFYELKTNKPLYFTREYVLTYDDGDMPTHYGFKVSSKLDRLTREYEKLAGTSRDKLTYETATIERKTPRLTDILHRNASKAVTQLDDRGAWVESGSLRYHDDDSVTEVITSRTFAHNLMTLAEYVAAAKDGE